MAKYNVGDVLEITEDFSQLGAAYKSGQKYVVESMSSVGYDLKPLKGGLAWAAHPDEFDLMESVRKVPSKEGFQVGDKVRLLETAHGSPGYSCDTPEAVKERLVSAGLDYQTVFEVDQKVDSDGDVHVFHGEKYVGLYLLPEFLVPWVEEVVVEEMEASAPEHMVVGEVYKNPSNKLYYRVDGIDYDSEKVTFTYGEEPTVKNNLGASRYFDEIEKEFGVLPPVKPETQEEPKFKVGQVWHNTCGSELRITEVDGSNITYVFAEGGTHSTRSDDLTVGWALVTQEVVTTEPTQEALEELQVQPETISVDSLREALDFLGIQEVFDTENIISLAKRLS